MKPENILKGRTTKKNKKALNVCFFSHSAGLCGAERTLLELVTELIKDYGLTCTIVLPENGPLKEKFEKIGALTYIINYSWWYDQKILPEEEVSELCINSAGSLFYGFKKILRRINPDIIVTNTISIPWGAIAASFLEKPHVWFVHEFGELDHGLKSFLPFDNTLKAVKNLSAVILTNSEAVRKKLFPEVNKKKALTVYQHINIPAADIYQKENSYFAKKDSIKLIISATVHEGKGQKDAILAVKELLRKGENAELIIMGHCNNQYAEYLKNMVIQENLKDYIKFIGFKENPYPIMSQADIILVCSKNEAFGRTTIEGMLLKKPVIATNRGGTLELIKEEINGLLYTPGNHHQLADKIEYLINHPEKAKILAENGYKFAKKTFTRHKFGERVYRLLVKLAAEKKSKASSFDLSLKGPALLDSLLAAAECKNRKITALIAEFGNSLKTKSSHINELTSSLQYKNNRISELESQLYNLEFQVQQIQQSILMQLASRYHKIMEKALPISTRRRHYYELFLTGIKVILNEGWHSFWHKLKLWFNNQGSLQKLTGRFNLYQLWIAKSEPKIEELEQQKKESLSLRYRPKISIVTPVWNPEAEWLRAAVESVISQTYDNWELCLADGNSTKPGVKESLQEYAEKDARIKVKFLKENKGIAGNSNEALSLATGEFIGLMDCDDELTPFALYEAIKLLNKKPETDFIYSDEDKITISGERTDPFFKPDWSPDMFLSCMYTCHFGVYRKKIMDEIGGFRSTYDGSQDYDLVLRFMEKTDKIHHIPKILYHWRMVPGSSALSQNAKPYAYLAAKKAISDYLKRNNIKARVVDGLFGSQSGVYRVKREIIGNPLVSIIIPTKGIYHILNNCIEALLEKTEYSNYEIIIVSNQATDQKTLDYFRECKNHHKIKVLEYNKPFNFSAINNYAVSQAQGKHVVFLNDGTEIISEEWLSAMLEHSQRKEIGAVGAMLLYPNNTIQHCGVVLGLGSHKVAGHAFYRWPDKTGCFGKIGIICNYSAVTAACMMMRKKVFEEIGGFDKSLAFAFNDVDLCLKIRKRGYFIVYTPYAQLYHKESYSRGRDDDKPENQNRFQKEINFMRAKWGSIIDKGDPYYNPNLTLDKEDFSIRI